MIVACAPIHNLGVGDKAPKEVILDLYYRKSDKSLFCRQMELIFNIGIDLKDNNIVTPDDLIGIPMYNRNRAQNETFSCYIVLKNGRTIMTDNNDLIVDFANNRSLARSVTNLRDFKTMVSI